MTIRYTTENDIEVRRTANGFDIYRNGRFETSRFSMPGAGKAADQLETDSLYPALPEPRRTRLANFD